MNPADTQQEQQQGQRVLPANVERPQPAAIEVNRSPAGAGAEPAARSPITVRAIQRMAQHGEKFACLTCYDATTARWLQRAGVPLLLVGDTAAEMILGYENTIHAPLEFMLMITAAVKRGAPHTVVMADMPFMSYQAEDAEGLRNAGRFLTEGNADLVKIEADRSFADLFMKMSRAGIPVVGHVGSRPQQVRLHSGYRSSGRTGEEARQVIDDAVALEQAGAKMLLIEATPTEVSEEIVRRTSVPVIGCGAGPACHGQIVVLQDLLGLSDWQPSFARPISNLGHQITEAAGQWIQRVRESKLGAHPYKMRDGESVG